MKGLVYFKQTSNSLWLWVYLACDSVHKTVHKTLLFKGGGGSEGLSDIQPHC